ncbi:M1 family metallopeptidase [Roseivirga pacifica]|nr:M1 family aminopeptidase [Roseivirga pacifica]
MKRFLMLLCLTMLIWGCNNKEAIKVEKGVSLELAQWRKANISMVNYKLEFRVPEAYDQQIQALEELTFNLKEVDQDLQLDFKEDASKLKGLIVNGSSVPILFEQEHLILPKEGLKEGFNKVEVNFFAGESSLNRKEEFLYTLFVPDRARTAFPCFDQPNLKATFELKLDLPNSWNAVANAPVGTVQIKDGRKQLEYQKSDLISTYLFSFVAGKFKSITETIGGRTMTMLHRETDENKVARNKDDVFKLHAASIQWLEGYTGIKYPFKKFDFALIPSFQYGGMEHVGAIQYQANSLFLDEDPSQNRLLSRASLIAHETAHMWFGNLVTMDWFNDVWTKEVFANFMAAKMVNPSFPEINHDLNFLKHYSSAYSVDRTEGANPIRQELPNLNEAGQMYGAIIYNKAPIMMKQLEFLIGEEVFRAGLQEYLKTYGMSNATWPNLIEILDKKSEADLKTWSEVWVNSPGRPDFNFAVADGTGTLSQTDRNGDKVWPQSFRMKLYNNGRKDRKELQVVSGGDPYTVALSNSWTDFDVLHNSNGIGYGLFPPAYNMIEKRWESLSDLEKGSLLLNAYENLIEPANHGQGNQYSPGQYLEVLQWIIEREQNQLNLNRAIGQITSIYWNLLDEAQRTALAPSLEKQLYGLMLKADDAAIKKMFFNAFSGVTITELNKQHLFDIWVGTSHAQIEGLKLSENDKIGLASNLAVKMPDKAALITNKQYHGIQNPDAKRRFAFIMPALSDTAAVRDAFFESLKDEQNRETESWVLSALNYLHHPLRKTESVKYIKPSLELLQGIQVTGDIFFPKRWLDANLGGHSSDEAIATVEDFLKENPNYNKQLKMKIQQSADFGKRANAILSRDKKITPR